MFSNNDIHYSSPHKQKNIKGGIVTIYERILAEYKRLDAQIKENIKIIKKLPAGKLVIARNGAHHKWYRSNGHTKTYIPKKQRKLAEQLAEKKFLTIQTELLSHEKRAIEFYLKHHPSPIEDINFIFEENSPYHELLAPNFLPKDKELYAWMNTSYEHNPNHPENLIHKGSSGNLLRSKSEAMIDSFLHVNKIPFRYECALQLGDIVLFPDFTIRHPITGKTYYWEHFGRMDEPAYYKSVYSKLQLYTSYGIVPSIQLITTYETKDAPLSAELIEKIIRHYFM